MNKIVFHLAKQIFGPLNFFVFNKINFGVGGGVGCGGRGVCLYG